jgi:hypothetical protein
MSFFSAAKEKVSRAITSIQNNSAKRRAANKIISAKSDAAYYKAKEKESIRYAQAKARHEADEEIKRLKGNGGQSSLNVFGFGGGGYSPLTGQSYGNQTRAAPRPMRYKRHRKGKGKKSKTRTRYIYRQQRQQPEREERFDPIGGF